MRIGWIGFHVEGLLALQGVLEHGYPLKAVITLKRELAQKRSGTADYTPLCQKYGIPLYEVASINDQDSLVLLRKLDLDLVFVIGWTQILRSEALRIAKVGVIGAHASLLPHNRGRAPINWALIRGEAETGNTLIWLTEEVDHGSIIDQVTIPVSMYDTCETLYHQVALSNQAMILRVLPQLLAGRRPGRLQEDTSESLLPGRRPEDGLIDWKKENFEIYNFIRGLTKPYPGAFSYLDGRHWLILQSALLPGSCSLSVEAGLILGPVYSPVATACGQAVACGTGAIVLLELEAKNGEIFRGRRLAELDWKEKVWTNGK